MSKHSTSEILACICWWSEESSTVEAVAELTLDEIFCRENWVELRAVCRWASSAVVCSLCSWKYTLRLFTESFRALKPFNNLKLVITSALNSSILPYIDLTKLVRMATSACNEDDKIILVTQISR